MKKLLPVLLLLNSLSVFADETPVTPVTPVSLERPAGKIDCNHQVQRCVYISQNITANDLMIKLNASAFMNGGISPTLGHIDVMGVKTLSFYIFDTELLNRVISLIPLLDTFEDFDPSTLVLVSTDIFSMTDSAFSEMEAQITASTNNPAGEIVDWVIKSFTTNTAAIGATISSNLLNSLLGSKKIKEESTKVITTSTLVSNLTNINYSQLSDVFISPTSGIVKSSQAGIAISGVVSISANNPDQIMIKNYGLKYGVIVPGQDAANNRVNVLDISNPQVYLTKGFSTMLASSYLSESTTNRNLSIISFGKKVDQIQNKLIIVTRAEPIKYSDYVSDLKKTADLSLHPVFSKEEIEKMPLDVVSIENLLNDLKPYAFFTATGDRVLGFKLNPSNARKDNIKKNIEIDVKSGSTFKKGSIDLSKLLPVESLMISGLKLGNLSSKDLDKKYLKIKISLKVFREDIKVTKELYYNPETNKFLE